MFLYQPEEYDPRYGTGSADYRKESGRNEFEYPTTAKNDDEVTS